MRTTVSIDDQVLTEAKHIAAATHRSLGSVFEDALRLLIARTEGSPDGGDLVKLPTDGRSGLQPGVDLEDKDALIELLERDRPMSAHAGR